VNARLFSLIYLLLLTAHLSVLAEVLPAVLRVPTKLSLVAALLVYIGSHWKRFGHKNVWKTLLAGLTLSLVGDALLVGEGELFFGLGLGAFLLAHVAYIFTFKQARDENHEIPFAQKYLLITLGMAVLGIVVFLSLQRDLGSMLVPVALYIGVITTMTVRAINRFRKTNLKSFVRVTAGAFLFLTSDTILAFHTFKHEMEFAPLLIMATYGLAQWGIATGIAAHCDENQA
jgi:uncharacterized membrane protein YhhN